MTENEKKSAVERVKDFSRSAVQGLSVKVLAAVIALAVSFLTGQILAYQAQQRELVTKTELGPVVNAAVEAALKERDLEAAALRAMVHRHEDDLRRSAGERADLARGIDYLVCAQQRPARYCARPAARPRERD